GTELAQQRVAAYARLLTGERLAERVVEESGADLTPAELIERIQVETTADTALIDVTVTAPSAEQARRLGTVLGDEFVDLVAEIETSTPVLVQRTEDASLPEDPLGQPVRDVALGLAMGLILAGLVVLVRARL